MESRKNPKLDIYRHSGLFFHLGMLITLVLVISAFEWKTEDDTQIDISDISIEGTIFDPVPIIEDEIKPPPKPKVRVINVIETPEDVEIDPKDLGLDQLTPDIHIEPIPDVIPDAAPEEKIETVTYAEVMPEPQGGYDALYAYIAKNMKYPPQAIARDTQGKVFVSFLIDENGNMKELSVMKGIGSGCDAEALRVLREVPPWSPGRAGGRKVRVRMVIPITFKLR